METERPTTAAVRQESVQEISARWIHLAVRWKRVLICVSTLFALLGFVVAILLPNRYTATVVLLPPQSGGSSSSAAVMAQLSGVGALAASSGGLGIKNPNEQQIAILKSRTVEDSMIRRFHLQSMYGRKYLSSTRKAWEWHAVAQSSIKDGLIRLVVTDKNPAMAAELANGWVEEYRYCSEALAVAEASQRRLFYEHELSLAHEALQNAENDLKRTEERTGVIDLDGQNRTMIASAAILRAQLEAKRVEVRAMREFAADQNPDLVRAEQEITALEGQLGEMDASAERKSGDLIAPRGTVTQSNLDYVRALREVKYQETIQDLLTRQYEGARVDEARQGALVQVLDPAVIPERPSSLYRLWIALGALLLAFPIGLAAVQIAERVSRFRLVLGTSQSILVAIDSYFSGNVGNNSNLLEHSAAEFGANATVS